MAAAGSAHHVEDPTFSEDDADEDEMEELTNGGHYAPLGVVARVIRDAASSHTERAAAERSSVQLLSALRNP